MTDPLSNPEPIFRIDGNAQGQLTRDALHVAVEEDLHGLRTLSVLLLAQGPARGSSAVEKLLFLDGDPLDFGKSIDVSLGGGHNARTVFKGAISAIEADFDEEKREPQVRVLAEDKLMSLRMTRRSKTYTDVTDAQIAKQVAEAHGVDAETDADGPTYDYVQQWNLSDLAFLRARAALIQAEIWFRDDKLYFKSRAKRSGTEVKLVQGNHLLQLNVRADIAHQRSEVKVSGFDAGQRDRIEKSAGSDAIQSEISGGRTGVSVLNSAFGARASLRVRDVPLADAEADAWARAEQLRRSRGFVRAAGVAKDTPDLEVGSKLTLEGVGRPFSGSGYYVTRICHRWDRTHGLRTHFEAERPTLSEAS